MGIFPPIKIVTEARHSAQNSLTGVRITTGTRYFAAVLAQEVYEARRFMAWGWLPFLMLGALAGLLPLEIGPRIGVFASALVWLMLAGKQVVPFRSSREKREVMGQAIELAAIRLIYERPNMESEYRLQARSMVRSDSPYKAKGFWPDIPALDPTVYTNTEALALMDHPSVTAMIALLKEQQADAEAYVRARAKTLIKWRALGEESLGY